MSATLLQTKLFVPPLRPGLVARKRLIEKLDQVCSPGCHAVILTAPAGFGKTTLITQWIETQAWPVSWLSLDENDNLLPRFFRYLVAAFQKIAPSMGQAAQALIGASRLDVEEIINSLANEASASPRPFVIVLDDYHNIHEQAIHQAVRILLDALPPQTRLVLLSREDPPLPVARLRARGQLVEIRSDELRFTAGEAALFLNQVMRLDLPAAQIQALEARTEGWIAGLQMAALSMQNISDRAGFIQAFSGSQRFILDYLVEEVLDRQSEEVQEFLLSTSILDRLCAELCDELMKDDPGESSQDLRGGRTYGAEVNPLIQTGSSSFILSLLDRSNLFLIPLDETRTWYRYHHLFADLLRARLKSTHPQILPELHGRASLWLELHDDPKAALDHAVAGKDFIRAADIIDRYIVSRWRETDLDFFMAVSQLPVEVLHSRPSLCLHAAWMYVITGRADRVLGLVEAAERHLLPIQAARPQSLTPVERGMLAFARVLRAYLDDFANRTLNLDPSIEQAVDAVPAENVGMRNSIAVVLGSIHYMEGDFPTAVRYFQGAIERDKLAEGTNAVPISVSRWARMLIIQGKLRETARLCQENEAYVRERGARRFYVAGNLNIMWGEVLREWGELEAAEKLIHEGLRLHESWPVPQALLMGFTSLARLQIARADWQAAWETLQRGLQITGQYQIHPDFASSFQAVLVCFWSARGSTAELEAWLREDDLRQPLPLVFRHETQHISRARALLALGRRAEGLDLLRRLRAVVEGSGRTGHHIEILTLLAAHLPAEQALPLLGTALRLAEPEGYLRSFAVISELRFLISDLRKQFESEGETRLVDYTAKILAAFRVEFDEAASVPDQKSTINNLQSKLPEPLSERELEVLRLVAAGLSNQHIADRLVISIRTVKKHLENVYGKLEVDNRVQAVTRAREIGII